MIDQLSDLSGSHCRASLPSRESAPPPSSVSPKLKIVQKVAKGKNSTSTEKWNPINSASSLPPVLLLQSGCLTPKFVLLVDTLHS